jgi:hypothetical protein
MFREHGQNGFDILWHFFSHFRRLMQFDNGFFALRDFLIACQRFAGILRAQRIPLETGQPLAKEECP